MYFVNQNPDVSRHARSIDAGFGNAGVSPRLCPATHNSDFLLLNLTKKGVSGSVDDGNLTEGLLPYQPSIRSAAQLHNAA